MQPFKPYIPVNSVKLSASSFLANGSQSPPEGQEFNFVAKKIVEDDGQGGCSCGRACYNRQGTFCRHSFERWHPHPTKFSGPSIKDQCC